MTHFMKLNKQPFMLIDSGKKTIEVRLYDRKRAKISVGDTILFTQINTENIIETKVLSINRYDSFLSLYNAQSHTKMGYESENSGDYTDMYEYYSKEDENLYGVLAIEIQKLY